MTTYVFLFPIHKTELFVLSRISIYIQWKNIQRAWINEYVESFITVSDESISRSSLMSTPEPYKSLLISKGQCLFSLHLPSLPYFIPLFTSSKSFSIKSLTCDRDLKVGPKLLENEVALLDGVNIVKGSIER